MLSAHLAPVIDLKLVVAGSGSSTGNVICRTQQLVVETRYDRCQIDECILPRPTPPLTSGLQDKSDVFTTKATTLRWHSFILYRRKLALFWIVIDGQSVIHSCHSCIPPPTDIQDRM
jgi:hypothetical protein